MSFHRVYVQINVENEYIKNFSELTHFLTDSQYFPQTDEQEVINFLLTTEIIPLCLRIMESGSELSKTVATFILQKILLDETGLNYICQVGEQYFFFEFFGNIPIKHQ